MKMNQYGIGEHKEWYKTRPYARSAFLINIIYRMDIGDTVNIDEVKWIIETLKVVGDGPYVQWKGKGRSLKGVPYVRYKLRLKGLV